MALRRAVLAALLCGCSAPPPGDPAAALAELSEARLSGEDPVLSALEERAREVLGRIEHPLDKDAWNAAVPRLRKELANSLGLAHLPVAKPRQLRSVGLLQRDGYSLEKLVWETFPGVEVPAHLYRPDPPEAKHPAILFVPGHWWADSKTRPDFQAFCITMARAGFVVLAYDPFGQGERGISLRDHRRTELLAVGVAQQAIVDFESLCALEVLLARPEVDRERVGITGASGGGYNSWVLAALDPRIAVSVPVVGTSEFHEQLRVCRPLDWYTAKEHCHFVPRLLRYANNHELAAMIAPRPLLVISAHNDQSFPIPGIREVVEYGRRLYGALGRPERIGYFEDESTGHGYQKRKREAAYGWFKRWLRGEGDGGSSEEPAFEIPAWDAAELRCFPPGGNRPAGPGLNALAKDLLAAMPAAKELPKDFGRVVADALGLELPPRLTQAPKLERAGARLQWTMRDGVTVPSVLAEPAGPWRGALLAAADAGKESLATDPAVRAALEHGFAVVACDSRGMGENAVTKPGWVFAVSLLLGENFVGRQAMDLVAGWRALRALPQLEGKPVGLLGSGPSASLAASYAAVLEPRAAFLVAEGGFWSYRAFVDRPSSQPESCRLAAPGAEKTIQLDREIPHALILFDALRRFDIQDLHASLAPRPAIVSGSIDGDWAPIGTDDLRRRAWEGRFAWPAAAEAVSRAELGDRVGKVLEGLRAEPVTRREPANPASTVERGMLPARIHVAEDYETGIERRWWLAGQVVDGHCRGTLANDFDDKMGDPSKLYTAVIFNPVPGPPMGKSTRLAFRYRLEGTDALRVQIYSLSNGYHRHLTLSGLPQGAWQSAAVDLTEARRPDGSGGPLAEDERIDDIQFYTDAAADLRIDDIVLYDAAAEGELGAFPARIIFPGWFDTGKQGHEWPGRFLIVSHEKPRTWKAARSTPEGELEVGLRGRRPLRGPVRLRFRYLLRNSETLAVALRGGGKEDLRAAVADPVRGEWAQAVLDFLPDPGREIDVVGFEIGKGAELRVDDLLLYEPEKAR